MRREIFRGLALSVSLLTVWTSEAGFAQTGIDLEKATNGHDADVAPGPPIPVGATVFWEYRVQNTGDVRLVDLSVTDDRGVAVSCPKSSLDPGESMTCTGSGTAVEGQYRNSGLVVGATPGGATVSDSDPSHYFGQAPPPPEARLEKATNGHDADVAPGPTIPVGDAVTWTYRVRNTGDVRLVDLSVTDDRGVAVSCPKSSLDPGESMTCTGSGTALAGQYRNVGTASGRSAVNGATVSDSDPSHYFGQAPPPRVDLEKATNGHDADAAPGPALEVGDPVTWTYVVTNVGAVGLASVLVTDDQGVAVSCPRTALAPGQSMTCTGFGTAVAGQYRNVGTASGLSTADGAPAADSDPSHYFGSGVDNPPRAVCGDVATRTDEGLCTADVSIDAGSFDPDGDSITLTQEPPPPYPLGETSVELTVSDGSLEDRCTGVVMVEDGAAPVVECNARDVTPPDLPVSFTATATDNCAVLEVVVVRPECFKLSRRGERPIKNCPVVLEGATVVIARRLDDGDSDSDSDSDSDGGLGVGTRVRWRAVAEDESGNELARRCVVDVVRPGRRR